MSFTGEVKKELCEAPLPSGLEGVFRYGVMYGLKSDKLSLVTDIDEVKNGISAAFGKNIKINAAEKNGKNLYKLNFLSEKPKNEGLDHEILKGDDLSTGIFLRGVFVSCGTVSVLKAGYHLELALHTENKCQSLLKLINEQGMSIKSSSRRGIPYLYTKNSENIADILTFTGAMQSAMEIMNIKIYKDFRSGINRAVNCEAANLGKTVAASAEQIKNIRFIDKKIGLDELPQELREIAAVRLDNPEVSLSELGKLITPHISRSGVNHRLERLKKIAEQLKEQI